MFKKIFFVLVSVISFSCLAGSIPDTPHVYVKGVGKITVLPDMAEIPMTVVTRNDDLIKAKREADQLSATIIKIAKQYQIAEKDISASELVIQRETDYDNITNKIVLLNYRVDRSVTLYLKDIKLYSQLLQSLVNAGITELNGIKLLASNEKELRQKAEKLAITDTIAAAKELAEGFGVKVNKLYRASKKPINESDAYSNIRVYDRSIPAHIVEGAFEPGYIDIEEVIYAVYLID